MIKEICDVSCCAQCMMTFRNFCMGSSNVIGWLIVKASCTSSAGDTDFSWQFSEKYSENATHRHFFSQYLNNPMQVTASPSGFTSVELLKGNFYLKKLLSISSFDGNKLSLVVLNSFLQARFMLFNIIMTRHLENEIHFFVSSFLWTYDTYFCKCNSFTH